MEELATYRWVAGPTSATDAARSFSRAARGRRGFWVFLGGIAVACGLLVSTGFDDSMSALARLAWGLVWGAAWTAFVAGVVLVVVNRSNRRMFRRRLRPGDELTSRFGPTAVELAGPLSRHELTYGGLVSVRRVGEWVHLRQVGSRLTTVWPADLFPDHELARLERLIRR